MKRGKIGFDSMPTAASKARKDALRTLGFRDYRQYLGSPLWRSIRNPFLREHDTCALCESPSEQVHHTSYSLATLEGKRPDKLVALCRYHHEFIEFAPGRRKRTFRQACNRLRQLLRERGL